MMMDDISDSDLESMSCSITSSGLSLNSYRINNVNEPKGHLLKFNVKRGILVKAFGEVHKQAVAKIIVG